MIYYNDSLEYRRHDSNHKIYNREEIKEEFNSIENTNECEVNNCNEINKTVEDIGSNVITSERHHNHLNINCEVIMKNVIEVLIKRMRRKQ